MPTSQPLDVALFGPLKRVWKRKVKEYKALTHAGKITKKDFPALLFSLFEESVLPEHLISRFRATGIHPLNKKAIRQDKLEASATFVPEDHQMLEDRLVGASPVTHKIAKFFLEKKEKKQEKGGGRVCPNYYGEALTEDVAFDRLREHKGRQRKQHQPAAG